MNLIFVYGTLKRGGSNHLQLAGQSFVQPARTVAGYRLFNLGSYPAMVTHAGDLEGVEGEVWSVDDACLRKLDIFEGVPEGLYQRTAVRVLGPFTDLLIEAYVYPHSVAGRVEIGSVWHESKPNA
jgi:gamma-glutamylaminecyclotransferase